MFKVAALLLLLVNQPVRYEVIGQLSSKLRMRFGQARLESLDGRFVEQTYFGPDGRRPTKIPDGQYVVTVRIGRIREIRQTISVFPEFADKKRRVSFKLHVEKAIVQQSAQKANVAALLVPNKARMELRKSFEAKGDLEKAQQHLEAALKIAPNFEEALNNLGTIYYRKHDFVAANRSSFERALKTNPDSFVGRVNLGGALLGLGQFDRALAENSKAAAQRPTDSLAQAQLGLSFFYLRRLDEALPHLEQAKQTDPFSPALPGLFLAMIHESMGNTSAAIAEYAEFLKMHPNHAASTNVERAAALKGNTEKQ